MRSRMVTYRDGAAFSAPADPTRGAVLDLLRQGSLPAGQIARAFPVSRPATRAARFRVGDRIRTVAVQPDHHTRLPAYARGKAGVVERVHGTHVFPDTNAQGLGESPQWLYTVAFEAGELWGDAVCEPRSVVSVDAFERYLNPG